MSEAQVPKDTNENKPPRTLLLRKRVWAIFGGLVIVVSNIGDFAESTDKIEKLVAKIYGAIGSGDAKPLNAVQSSSPEPEERRVDNIAVLEAPVECTDLASISDLFDRLGPGPTVTKQANFSVSWKGKRICKGLPAVVESVTRDSKDGTPIVLVTDPDNRRLKMSLRADEQAMQYRDGAAVTVTADLSALSDREYIEGIAAKLTHRKVSVRASREKGGQKDDGGKPTPLEKPNLLQRFLGD